MRRRGLATRHSILASRIGHSISPRCSEPGSQVLGIIAFAARPIGALFRGIVLCDYRALLAQRKDTLRDIVGQCDRSRRSAPRHLVGLPLLEGLVQGFRGLAGEFCVGLFELFPLFLAHARCRLLLLLHALGNYQALLLCRCLAPLLPQGLYPLPRTPSPHATLQPRGERVDARHGLLGLPLLARRHGAQLISVLLGSARHPPRDTCHHGIHSRVVLRHRRWPRHPRLQLLVPARSYSGLLLLQRVHARLVLPLHLLVP